MVSGEVVNYLNMFTFLFIILSAIMKAIVDTLSHHYKNSIFFEKSNFWNIKKQGKFLPFTKYPLDGWHICNSLMIISFIFFGILHDTYFNLYLDLLISGILFIIIFNLFYNKFLKK